MHPLNYDDSESQIILTWFSENDVFEIKTALTEIAITFNEIEKYAQEHLSATQHQELSLISTFSPRFAILIGIIQGLIDPFISQTPIGDALKRKAGAILQEVGISSSTYSTRPIEIDSIEFRKIFQSILSKG